MDRYAKILNEAVGFDIDIETETLKNTNFRKVLHTASNMQLVVMSITDEIGMETHDDIDQFFRVEGGIGKVIIDGREFSVKSKTAFIVPKGSKHNIINTGNEDLKLYTVYAPPKHPPKTIHRTKEDAKSAEGLTEAGFEKIPKGWDKNSLHKYMSTFTKRMKGGAKATGFFDKCVEKVRDKMDNPEGFCASLKDEAYGSTGWRGKDKSPKEISKDIKKPKFKVEADEAINDYLSFICEYDGGGVKKDGAPIPNELIRMLEYEEQPNWIGYCVRSYEGQPETQVKCLQAVKEYAAANPFYQYRIDRYIDKIMDNWDGSSEVPYPTENPDEREVNLGSGPEKGYSNMDHLEPGMLEFDSSKSEPIKENGCPKGHTWCPTKKKCVQDGRKGVIETGMADRIPSGGLSCDTDDGQAFSGEDEDGEFSVKGIGD
jgi:mannose-6-phosphate isomerase-like protein (cupin superfamily)